MPQRNVTVHDYTENAWASYLYNPFANISLNNDDDDDDDDDNEDEDEDDDNNNIITYFKS